MHFSIPDTQEFLDNTGTAYVGYNIHINGLLHCTVRYKQLHSLHEQLSKDPDMLLPPFPPKKFFPLTSNQQEERRLSLEKYIQTIGQNAATNKLDLLNGFLLNAQIETAGYSPALEDLEVFLMNGRKLVLNATIADHTGTILQKMCKQFQLSDQYIPYFTLFIMVHDENGDVNVYRKLQDFESPVLTLRNIQKLGTRVVLGKWYWDIGFDLEIMTDEAGLHLLYAQAMGEIERSWVLVSDDTRDHLDELCDSGNEKKYFEIARASKYHGYIHFEQCYCDYPQPQSRVRVAIGRNELNLRISTVEDEEKEVVFRVTNMRCWRITTVHSGTDEKGDSTDSSLELSFEYLAAKNKLIWITIASDQAILMSVCIQSMIDELLLKKVSGTRNQVSSGKPWTYIMRDGHSRVVIGPSTLENSVESNKSEDVTDNARSEPIIKKLTERFSAMNRRRSSKSNSFSDDGIPMEYDARENRAFRVIGDDDL